MEETPDSPEAMKTVPGLELSDIPKDQPLSHGSRWSLCHISPEIGGWYIGVILVILIAGSLFSHGFVVNHVFFFFFVFFLANVGL